MWLLSHKTREWKTVSLRDNYAAVSGVLSLNFFLKKMLHQFNNHTYLQRYFRLFPNVFMVFARMKNFDPELRAVILHTVALHRNLPRNIFLTAMTCVTGRWTAIMAADDSLKARFDHVFDSLVACDAEEMRRNKRVAKLIVLNFCKYLRQKKLCETTMLTIGNAFRNRPWCTLKLSYDGLQRNFKKVDYRECLLYRMQRYISKLWEFLNGSSERKSLMKKIPYFVIWKFDSILAGARGWNVSISENDNTVITNSIIDSPKHELRSPTGRPVTGWLRGRHA